MCYSSYGNEGYRKNFTFVRFIYVSRNWSLKKIHNLLFEIYGDALGLN